MVKISQREQNFIDSLLIGSDKETVSNMFSGEKCVLEPLGVALYDFIMGTQVYLEQPQKSQKETITLISQFDMARNIFRKMYPNEYMILID